MCLTFPNNQNPTLVVCGDSWRIQCGAQHLRMHGAHELPCNHRCALRILFKIFLKNICTINHVAWVQLLILYFGD